MAKRKYQVGETFETEIDGKIVTATIYYIEKEHPSGLLYFATYNDPEPVVFTFIPH